jgi:hypothetical protein
MIRRSIRWGTGNPVPWSDPYYAHAQPRAHRNLHLRARHRLPLRARRSLHPWARRKRYVRARSSPVADLPIAGLAHVISPLRRRALPEARRFHISLRSRCTAMLAALRTLIQARQGRERYRQSSWKRCPRPQAGKRARRRCGGNHPPSQTSLRMPLRHQHTPHRTDASVDNLVSAGDQPRRDFEAERLAVLRLIIRSNFCGDTTGRSSGLAPLRIRSA